MLAILQTCLHDGCMNEDEQLLELGALRADDDDDDDDDDEHDGDDLNPHTIIDDDDTPIAKPEEQWIDMGTRPVARTAEGLKPVVNVLEVLPPFEFSV